MGKILVISFIALLAGCAAYTDGAKPLPAAVSTNVCPHTSTWTQDQIKQLGVEDAQLAPTSMAHKAIAEAYALRSQIHKACGG